MRGIRRHLSFANVVSVIALFVAISGGTAVALNGSNTVQSDDLGPGAQVKAPDVAANAVGSGKVINESLTGQDIKNQSGVDTCVSGTRLGQLCVRAENDARPWIEAAQHCANLDMRLASITEALELAKTHDIPNVDQLEDFWTSDRYRNPSGGFYGDVMNDDGVPGFTALEGEERETVCVTTPTN